jgi:hypothetical protein
MPSKKCKPKKQNKPKQKTIKFSELKRLSFCASRKMPSRVVMGNKVYEHVSIGWIESDDEPCDNIPRVVDD